MKYTIILFALGFGSFIKSQDAPSSEPLFVQIARENVTIDAERGNFVRHYDMEQDFNFEAGWTIEGVLPQLLVSIDTIKKSTGVNFLLYCKIGHANNTARETIAHNDPFFTEHLKTKLTQYSKSGNNL